jgi:hypothetical protein
LSEGGAALDSVDHHEADFAQPNELAEGTAICELDESVSPNEISEKKDKKMKKKDKKDKSLKEKKMNKSKSKKEKHNDDGEGEEKFNAGYKKSKKLKGGLQEDVTLVDEIDITKNPKKDKKKSEKKRKRESLGDIDGVNEDDGASKKDKKKKKKKHSEAIAQEDEDATTSKEAKAAVSDNWNVQALDGGSDRQQKFARLLGGLKKGIITTSNNQQPVAKDQISMNKIQEELQRQYETGLRMKFGFDSQKRGLGS